MKPSRADERTAKILGNFAHVHELDRDKAAPTIWAVIRGELGPDRALNALEGCVVPDPRIARIEALCDASDSEGDITVREVRTILRGDA